MDSTLSHIRITGTLEEIERISIFLENNHIQYVKVDTESEPEDPEEWPEAIDWPL